MVVLESPSIDFEVVVISWSVLGLQTIVVSFFVCSARVVTSDIRKTLAPV